MAPKNTPRKPASDAPLGEPATTERTSRRAGTNSRTRRDQRQEARFQEEMRQYAIIINELRRINGQGVVG